MAGKIAPSSSELTAFYSARSGWRSREGSPLTEELALFLGRYGVRLARDDHVLSKR